MPALAQKHRLGRDGDEPPEVDDLGVPRNRALSYLEVLDDEYWALNEEKPSAAPKALREAYEKAETALEEARAASRPDPRLALDLAQDLETKQQAFRDDLLMRLHEAKRSALCLSGGGIRSATFGLGVLQALACHAPNAAPRESAPGGLDYLSTVSGGGYIGAWFSAWARRLWATPVVGTPVDGPAAAIAALRGSGCDDLAADPSPVRHLREYSNYLTPKLGLTSGDTWAVVGAVVRNLVLNWLVLVPLLSALLLVPEGAAAALPPELPATSNVPLLWTLLAAGLSFAAVATAYVGYDLPSLGNAKRQWTAHMWFCLLPLVLAGVSLSTFWWLLPHGDASAPWWNVIRLGKQHTTLWQFAATAAVVHAGGIAVGIVLAAWTRALSLPSRRSPRKLARAFSLVTLRGTGAAAASGLLSGSAAFVLAMWGRNSGVTEADPEFYACAAFPLVIGVFLASATLLVGFASYFTGDKDREWWARSGGMALAVAMAWPIFGAIVLYAPEALEKLRITTAQLAAATGLTGWGVAKLGSLPGQAPAAAGPRMPLYPLPGWVADLAARLVLPFFMVLLAMLLANGNHEALKLVRALGISPGGAWPVLALGAVYTGLSLAASRFINVNSFSLHAMYRERIVRAFLGASNTTRAAHPFTGFDEGDDLPMWSLAPQRPLHVVNMALNVVGGSKLAWQHRKAESFTATRLHTGGVCTGYRPSRQYGGETADAALSLGTTMAVSGAAASPNMGYNSSPLVTLVMTLFNLRLGWWLGNPKDKKGRWRKSGPFGVRPFIDEALGRTSDDNTWVNLSDGGHFDNLGLYEMVLRRCHVIVVSDAGADPRRACEDLANAIRRVRVDLGVSIEFEGANPMRNLAGPPDESGVHCAVARIVYPPSEPWAHVGTLVYLKPSLTGDEPIDVASYAEGRKFPHDPTSDQFFDEPQFESYRRLGAHVIETIWKTPPAAMPPDASPHGLAAFVARARALAATGPGAPMSANDVSVIEECFAESCLVE